MVLEKLEQNKKYESGSNTDYHISFEIPAVYSIDNFGFTLISSDTLELTDKVVETQCQRCSGPSHCVGHCKCR